MNQQNTPIENIDRLKKAIEIEVAHRYIDIRGRSCPFSMFILNELKNIQRQNKENPKWKKLVALFSRYSTDDLSARMSSIRELVNALKNPSGQPKSRPNFLKKPEDTDVMYVKGVGPRLGDMLNKLGIFTASDLLCYYPRKYLDYSTSTLIEDLEIGMEACVFGEIKNVHAYTSKRGLNILTITVADYTGAVTASWFYGRTNPKLLQKYKSQYPKGAKIILTGKVKYDDYQGSMAFDNPQVDIIGSVENATQNVPGLVPVYPLTEKLNIKTLRNAIKNALELYADNMPEIIPAYIKKKHNLLSKSQALHLIHFPQTEEELEQARQSLVFEELFLVQLKFAYLRQANTKILSPQKIKPKENGLLEQFIKSLPFELTDGQKNAFNEILSDMKSEEPMGRLLQGDVGSGKTVVACLMLLAAIENGFQGALMAPTEILAEQHYKNFVNWLTPLGLSVGLFVGKHSTKTRKQMRENLLNGQMNLAIGTHALIQDGVEFQNLGAVVVDEQHRFGVKQRSLLKEKGLNPELLTMSATPIPRTLALTVHGDLDLTIINEMPKGRKPIITTLIQAGKRRQAYEMIKKEIISGNQVYVVFPLIEESETLSAKAATKEAERLQREVFPQYKIGLVHGKLSPQEKETVMEDFRAKKYDILVSTTVIEVGVDVPDATLILIENAERFGLSQLHQLRGRVGRSDKQSYCVLITDSKNNETINRLKIMEQSSNGFVIAEKDLEIRGPGEFLGTRQSGLPDLSLADIIKDTKTLEIAREEAFDFLKNEDIKAYSALFEWLKDKITKDLDIINSG